MQRCPWCEGFDLYRQYHDLEWGVPVHDDRTHFEFLVLEMFLWQGPRGRALHGLDADGARTTAPLAANQGLLYVLADEVSVIGQTTSNPQAVLPTTQTVPHWWGSTTNPQNGVTYGYNMVGA